MGCSWLNGRKGERWKTGRKCRKELQAPHGARFGSTARSSSAQIPLTHQLPLIGIPAHPSEEEAGSPCDLSVAARWVSHTGPEAEQCAPTQKIFAWAGKCLRLNFEFFFLRSRKYTCLFLPFIWERHDFSFRGLPLVKQDGETPHPCYQQTTSTGSPLTRRHVCG